LAIVGLGRRDVPFDHGLPVPLTVRRPDGTREPLSGRVPALDDQHAYLHVPAEAVLRAGDLVELGLSHPCSVFDRWSVLPVVSGDAVVDVVHTLF
jgi:D-serine deaminase-like pyridoxal phosphate-dependent protein